MLNGATRTLASLHLPTAIPGRACAEAFQFLLNHSSPPDAPMTAGWWPLRLVGEARKHGYLRVPLSDCRIPPDADLMFARCSPGCLTQFGHPVTSLVGTHVLCLPTKWKCNSSHCASAAS
jgi:hypothetical protein